MPRAIAAQTGWPGGEWSPRLIGRFDLEQYNRALQYCENAIPLPQGVIIRRPPTRWLANIPVSPSTRLIPFIVDNETVSVVVMQPGSFRVYDPVSGNLIAGPVAHGISAQDIERMAWAQDSDIAYLVFPGGYPHKITRVTPTSYTIATVSFVNGRAPLAPINVDASKTATLSGTWPNLTVTMSANTFIAADVGRAFFMRDFVNKRAVYCTITAVSSPTVATLVGGFQIGGPSLPAPGPDWALGLFSNTKGCNAVCFHEARLWYGGFAEEPDLVVGSVSNSFDNFETISPDPTVGSAANADKSVARRVDGAPIIWVASSSLGLVVGAAQQESVIVPGVTGVLTPVEASVRQVTQRGSEAYCPPVRIDQSLFFIERGGRRIRQIKATDSTNFETLDATVLTQHFTAARLYRVAYQQAPYSVLWALDRERNLYGWTIEGEQQVLGGHRQRLGGAYNGRAPLVDDLACVPVSRDGTAYDGLVLAVRRIINGTETASLEIMEPNVAVEGHIADETPREKMVSDVERLPYVDCYVRLSGNRTYKIVGAAEVSGRIVFTYSADSPHPTAGEQIVFRGLAWQNGNQLIDTKALNRDTFTVESLNTVARTFRIRRLSATADAAFADYGLPATSRLYIYEDGQLPFACNVITSAPAITNPPGDALTYVADTVFKVAITSSAPASLVFRGHKYMSRIRTMPLKLSQGLVPTDAGEPAVVSRVTLRLRAAIGGMVSVGGESPETLVMGTTDDLMDGPPVPAYRDFTIPVNGSWTDDTTVVISTDTPFPFEVLGIYSNMKTNVR